MDTNTNYVMDTISHSPSAFIFGACCVFYLVAYPIVKYYQDPKGLRKYPNMTLFSGISDIPFMILAHTGARSRELVKIHKKRPVLRTGPNTLSYTDPRAIKDIYGHGTKCTKDGSYVVGAGSHYHLADVVDKSDHARKRKVLSSAYALKNLEGWEHKVADKTARAIRHFDKCCTAPLPSNTTIPAKEDVNLDYRKWMNFFTLDAIADIGLSEKLGFLDRGSDEVMGRKTDGTRYECNLRECLYASNRKQSLLLWSYDYYKVIDKLANFVPFYGRLGQLGAKWDGVPLDLSYRRLERYRAGEKLDDFFQALMEDKNGSPNNLEMGEIVAEVSIMMNAGSVTTAVAMTNIIYQLLKNPEIKKKLVEELDAALDDENEDEDDDTSEDPFSAVVSYDRVKHLPYMRACLDESLRLFPPTPHNLGRQTPPEGATILGDYIPGGVSVGMTALAVHWNEEVFPEPHKFIPERWLGEEGKNNQPYFLAFSAGARGCIGRNISYLEQAVVLASVLRRYEFALPHPGWEIERREGMNWLLGDMPVKIWRRQRVAA